MKSKLKTAIEDGLLKGLISVFVFMIFYTFVFSMIMKSNVPLLFIAKNGYVHTYLVVSMLLGALPYVLCGYLIMLGRNKRERLREKNRSLALAIFSISFIFYLIITVIQFIFTYRNIYDFYIFVNFPLLRATQHLELNLLQVNMMMLTTTVLPALFIYSGGILRLKTIGKGGYHG